jgi:hypothetical protein
MTSPLYYLSDENTILRARWKEPHILGKAFRLKDNYWDAYQRPNVEEDDVIHQESDSSHCIELDLVLAGLDNVREQTGYNGG